MKWYERQKQLYAQKSQAEEPVAPREEPISSIYEGVIPNEEPVYEEVSQDTAQQYYEEMVEEDQYEETYEDEQLDEILEEDSPYIPNEHFTSVNIPAMEEMDQSEATTISKGTNLIGNIETDDDLIIRGHIKGDIICNGNLSVYGVVEGTINCANAYFDEAIIVGDIGCSGNLQLTATSTIDGNVEAFEVMNGGRIKGNAVVAQSIHFLSTSAIVGDISANDIDIERGAVIQGNINIRQEVYFGN